MIYLRHAEYPDMDLLYDWANDPAVRSFSFCSDIIAYDIHKEWFHSMMNNDAVIQYILMDEDVPVGQIRLEMKDIYSEIGYSVASKYRGKGYGYKMLQLAEKTVEEEYPQIIKLVAKVKSNNAASKKTLEKAGYEKIYPCFPLQIDPDGCLDVFEGENSMAMINADVYERRIIR